MTSAASICHGTNVTVVGTFGGSGKKAFLSVCFSGANFFAATGGIWSGYQPGTISDATSPQAVFTPGPAQAGGNATLTWTSTGGPCPPVSASFVVGSPQCGLSLGAIIGIAIGGAILLVALVVLIVFLAKRFRNESAMKQMRWQIDRVSGSREAYDTPYHSVHEY